MQASIGAPVSVCAHVAITRHARRIPVCDAERADAVRTSRRTVDVESVVTRG
jgi:hypothetical protein